MPHEVIPPAAMQALPVLSALQHFREGLIENGDDPLDEILDSINAYVKANPNSDRELVIRQFASKYAERYFSCDVGAAIDALKLAMNVRQAPMLLWGYLRDIASPVTSSNVSFNTGINPKAQIRELLQMQPDAFETYFGSADYVTCPHERSILSPGAYLADLLRLVEYKFDKASSRSLERRRPDIYSLPLSPSNTYDTIPYLQLVNETLSSMITREYVESGQGSSDYVPSAYEIISDKTFPFTVPFHYPLEKTRANLEKTETSFVEILKTLRQTNPLEQLPDSKRHLREIQEILRMSPAEWDLLASDGYDEESLRQLFGLDKSKVPLLEALSDVDMFMKQTKLSREQLQELVYLDLSDAELNTGLSRHFFINDVNDGKGALRIVLQGDEFGISGELKERLQNLTLKKLDRILRIVRLAKKLGWSFVDLDWVLRSVVPDRSVQTQGEQCLYFDGINDAVAVKTAAEGFFSFTAAPLHVEGWILPKAKRGVEATGDSVLISSYDSAGDQRLASWSVVLTAESKLKVSVVTQTAGDKAKKKVLTSLEALEVDKDVHFSVPVSLDLEKLFINGVPALVEVENDQGYDMPAPSNVAAPDKSKALLLFASGPSGEEFHGNMQEIRIWRVSEERLIRDEVVIRESMYERLSGYEEGLIGYWPMTEGIAGRTIDASLCGHDGLLGGGIYACRPRWVASSLNLDERPKLDGMTFGSTDYENHFLSAEFTMGDNGEMWDSFQIGFWVRFNDKPSERGELILMLGAKTPPSSLMERIENAVTITRTEENHIKVSMNDDEFKSGVALMPGRLFYVLIHVKPSEVRIQVRGPMLKDNSNADIIKSTTAQRRLWNDVPTIAGALVGAMGFNGTLHDIKIWTGLKEDAASSVFDATSSQGKLIAETSQVRAFWPLSSISDSDVGRVSKDESSNRFHLKLAKLASSFSPQRKEPTLHVVKPATALAMDGKSAIRISNSNDVGLGRMLEGTVAFWFKPLSVPASKTQLLFAHGEDDVGISVYLESNSSVVVIAWTRIYDSKMMKFVRTEREKLITLEQGTVKLDEWHVFALAFEQDGEGFEVNAIVDGRSGPVAQVPLSPTEAFHLGGLADTSDGWIVFDDADVTGSHAEIRPHVYFSGHMMDFRLWNTKLEADEVRKLMSRSPEIGLGKNLQLSVPLDTVHKLKEEAIGKGTYKDYLEVSADQWQEPETSCSAGVFEVTLHRQKNVIENSGDGVYASEYSFYTVSGSETWADYGFRGRMKCTDSADGAGVVFYSSLRTAQDGVQYRDGFALVGRLLANGSRSFELMTLSSLREPDVRKQVGPPLELPNSGWYRFSVQVRKTTDGIEIGGKVWRQEKDEPDDEQLKIGSTKLAQGTVGLWSAGVGDKKYDDLMIYKEGSWSPLFSEGFEEIKTERNDNWLDLQTHLTMFKQMDPSRPGECIGFDTLHQRYEEVAAYVSDSGPLLWGLPNGTVKIRGRMMFETDATEIGLYLGISGDGRSRNNSLALMRAPFRANYRGPKLPLKNAFLFRLEARNNATVETFEFPGIIPVHSRWYRFELEISSRTQVGVKLWEDGSAEPLSLTMATFQNWRPKDNTRLGLMGRLAGKKFFSDLVVEMVDRAGSSEVFPLPNSVTRGEWDGNVKDFRTLQPENALVGGGVSEGQQALSLYRSTVPNEKLHWQVRTGKNDYSFSGRVFFSSADSSFAIVVSCRAPFGENRYCSIQRTRERPFLHAVAGYGDLLQFVNTATESTAVEDVGWYCFRVFINPSEDKVEVKARLWKQRESEPPYNAVEISDSSGFLGATGTVGVWSNMPSTVFDSLRVEEDLGVEHLTGPKAVWSQYVAKRVSQFFGGFTWKLEEAKEEFFNIIDAGSTSEIEAPGDVRDRYFCLTEIQATKSLTVKAQVLLKRGDAEAGLIVSSRSWRSSTYGVVLKSGDGSSAPGMLSLVRFDNRGAKLNENTSFLSLNSATSRINSITEVKPNVWYNVVMQLGEAKSVEGDAQIRIRAKVWGAADIEPSHFMVVGYTSDRFDATELGVFSAGRDMKRIRIVQVSSSSDLLNSGNRVWDDYGWVNGTTASVTNSLFTSYVVRESADDSLLWLRREQDAPNRAQNLHLDFSGAEQFLAAKTSAQLWTFQTTVLPREQTLISPVLSVKELPLEVWIKGGQDATVNVRVGDKHEVQSYDSQRWKSILVTAVLEEGQLVVDFLGIKRFTIPRAELNAERSYDLYIGRGQLNSDGDFSYFEGQMTGLLLLSRDMSMEDVYSDRAQTHSSIVGRESAGGSLEAAWPLAGGLKEFTFGGFADEREPIACAEVWGSVTAQGSAWGPQALALVFDSTSAASLGPKGLAVPFDAPKSGIVDLRSRSLQIAFRVTDVATGTVDSPQQVYREGQIQLAVADGKLYYVVGYDSLAKAIAARGSSVLSVDVDNGQWYAAALTFAAGKHTRPGAVMAYLDGAPTGVADGALLAEHVGNECYIGGGSFEGIVLSVQVLSRVASLQDIANFAKDPSIALADSVLSLSGESWGSIEGESSIQKLSACVRDIPKVELVSVQLENMAYLSEIMRIHRLDVNRAMALIGLIKDFGRKDGKVPYFDILFNSGTVGDDWSLQMKPVPWSADGQSIADVVTNIRLAKASGFSKTSFDQLLEHVEAPTAIEGTFLQRLISAARLSKLLGVEPKLLGKFMEAMGVTQDSLELRDVLKMASVLNWFQSRGISTDDILELLGLYGGTILSVEDLNELSQSVSEGIDNFRINKEALQSEFLPQEELDLIVVAVTNVEKGFVNAETGLVKGSYFYEGTLQTMRGEKVWIDAKSRAWKEFFSNDFEKIIVERSLQEDLKEFGSLETLVRGLLSVGVLFGSKMHDALSTQEILKLLQTESTEPSPPLGDTPGVEAVLDALVEEVIPTWAEKVEDVEKKILERRTLMDTTVANGIADSFDLDSGAVSRIFEIPGFVSVADVVMHLLDASDDARVKVSEVIQIAQVADTFEMADVELEAYVASAEVRNDVFGVSSQGTVKALNLVSAAGLTAYRAVADFVKNRYEELGIADLGDGAAELVDLLRSKTSFAKVDSIADVLHYNPSAVALALRELLEMRGLSSEGQIDVFSLWYISRVLRASSDLSVDFQQLKLFGLAGLEWKEFEDLATLSTSSLRSTNDSNKVENDVFASVGPRARDALVGVIESFFDAESESNVNNGKLAKSADSVSLALSDLVLLDVQTGPAVRISRVQQAIQSTQLFIHKAVLREENLLPEPDREFVKAQWDLWMKNYRVWEAARRVFLYPENYVEPELRSGSTTEFERLTDKVSGGGDVESISSAVSDYVAAVGDVLTKLRIAGAGYYYEDNDGKTDVLERLMIVGKSTGTPSDVYIRQRITRESYSDSSEENPEVVHVVRWGNWEKVEQVISASWVSPCYAFGSLHLFWVEWQPENVQYYLLRNDYLTDLRNRRGEAEAASGSADTDIDAAEKELRDAEKKRSDAQKNIDNIDKLLEDLPDILGISSEEFKRLRKEEILKKAKSDISEAKKDEENAMKKKSNAQKVKASFEFYESLFIRNPNDIRQFERETLNDSNEPEVVRLVQKELMDERMSNRNDAQGMKDLWGDSILDKQNRPSFISVPVLTPTIKFLRQNGNGSWATPQSYPKLETRLIGDVKLNDSEQVLSGDHREPGWQRLYCMRASLPRPREDTTLDTLTKPLVFDATVSREGIRITNVPGVVTIDFLAKNALSSSSAVPFSRSLSYYDNVVAQMQNTSDPQEVQNALNELRGLGFFGPPQGHVSIPLLSVSSQARSGTDGTLWLDVIAALQPEGIQGAYEAIDETLVTDKTTEESDSDASDATAASFMKFGDALKVLTGDPPAGASEEDKKKHAKEKLEELFGETDAKHILSVQAAGKDSTVLDRLKTSAILKERAGYQSLKPGIYFQDPEFDAIPGSESAKTNIQELPNVLLGNWSHYVLTFGEKVVTVKARRLVPPGEPQNEQVSEWDMKVSAPFDDIDEVVLGGGDQNVERRNMLLCEMSEARTWNKAIDLFSAANTERWERHRISSVDRQKAEAAGLSGRDGLFNLRGVNRELRNVIFKEALGLELTLSIQTADDFMRERIVIIHNGNVYSVESTSSQTFVVTVEGKSDSVNIGLVMEADENDPDEGQPNPGARIYAVRRSAIPALSSPDSPQRIDFFSGSDLHEISPATIVEAYKGLKIGSGDKINLLGSNLKWKAATVQPVQNMLCGFIVETGHEAILVTTNAVSTTPGNETQPATKRVADLLELRVDATGTSAKLALISDPNPPNWDRLKAGTDKFSVERISSPALLSVVERMEKGGFDALYSEAAQQEVESPSSDPNDTFSSKFLEAGAEKYLEFVRSGADKETFQAKKPFCFDSIDFDGTNGPYYREMFFHVPMLIADALNANSQFADSRTWFEYVFDPFGPDADNPWRFLPFRLLHKPEKDGKSEDNGRDTFVRILGDEAAVREFRERPFDAHLIAASRNFAYPKSVFIKYVSNILDAGDTLFVDNRESINEAMLSYFMAAKVLGNRPREIPRSRRIMDTSFRTIEKARSQDKLLKSFVVPKGEGVVDSVALSISFCVPENEKLLSLWTRTEDRLYKIRNSLDIDGNFRQLDLFAPPIDPAALVAAFAAGGNARDALLNLNRPVPHYRFDAMMENAISAVDVATELGNELLSALEAFDAESLMILEADQRRQTTALTEIISGHKVSAARHERQALEINLRRVDNEVARYEGLLNKGTGEKYKSRWIGVGGKITGATNKIIVGTLKSKVDDDLAAKAAAKTEARAERLDKAVGIYIAEKEKEADKVRLEDVKTRERSNALDEGRRKREGSALNRKAATAAAQAGSEAAAATTSSAPDAEGGISGLGGFSTIKFGGEQLSRFLGRMALVLETASTAIDIATEIMALNNEQAVLIAGWERSLGIAKLDRLEADEQLGAAVAMEEAAVNEESLAANESLYAEQTYLYHESKFTGKELYNWLANRLKRAYRNSYQLALQTAKEAERALQYELPTERTFVSGNAWSSPRNGLLAAQMLRLDLQRMQAYKTEQDSRFLEIERRVSMRNELGEAWAALLQDGECEFELKEEMFDVDYLGHYFRVLKTVAVSVLTNLGEEFEKSNSLRATLEQTRNRTLMTPDENAVRFLMKLTGAQRPNSTVVRTNLRPNQAVALSKWQDDTGMFVTDFFRDDRYFPFEGTGAVSTWRLSIPPESNPGLTAAGGLNRQSADVVLSVKYSAQRTGEPFVSAVEKALVEAREAAANRG